jgi:hypothetical protein
MIKLEELCFTYQTGVTGMINFLLKNGANRDAWAKHGKTH